MSIQKKVSQRLALPICLFLSACTTTTTQLAEQPVETAPAEPTLEVVEKPLPNKALDAEALYNILMSDIALQRRQPETALESAIAVANDSRDYRLVKKAAALALRAGDYAQAAEMARLWSELLPDDEEPRQVLVIALTADDQVELAKEAAVALVESARTTGYGIRVIAGLMGQQRNAGAAIRLMEELAAKWPENAQAQMSLSYVARSFGRDYLGTSALDRALELRPDWDEAAVAKADSLARAGEQTEAEQYITEYLERNPDSIVMRVRYARYLAGREEYLLAWEKLKPALNQDEIDAPTWYFAAVLAAEVDQERLVTRYLERALEQDPGFDRARMYLAARYAGEEDFEAAFDQYQQVTDVELSEDAMIQMVLVTEETKGTDEALSYLERMNIQNQAQYLKYVLTRHELLVRARRMDEAYGFINEAMQELPGNRDLLYARGLLAAELKLIDVMEADFRTLLKQEPENAHALNALGYTLADQTERLDEARDLIVKAFTLRPEDPYIMDSMGWVEYRLGKLEVARDLLDKAYQVNGDVEIAAHLGEVLWELGEAEAARDIWREAEEKEADNPILVETLQRYPALVVE